MDKEVRCKYSKDEAVNALSRAVGINVTKFLLGGLFLLVLGIVFLVYYIFQEQKDSFTLFIIIFEFICAFLSILFYIYLLLRRKGILISNKVKKQSNVFKDGLIYEFKFKEKELTAVSRLGEKEATNTHNYSEFLKYYENEDYIYLFLNNYSCYVIKRNFLSDEERKELKSLIGKK